MAPKRRRTTASSSRSHSNVEIPAQNPQRGRQTTTAPPPEIPPPPFALPSQEHIARYNTLALKPMIPNRFIDEHALGMVGLRDAVIEPLRRIGWGDFITMKDYVYPPLTLEFLSTYDSYIYPTVHTIESKIAFRLGERSHELTINELSHIFGFPTENASTCVPITFSSNNAWQRFTGSIGYTSKGSKATNLRNPAHRYIHRFLARTIFGRKESDGVVGVNELYFLWAIEEGIRLNVGYWLGVRWKKVAKGNTGSIVMGSFVTRIGLYLRVFNPERTPYMALDNGKNTRIDIEVMQKMGMVVKHGDTFRLAGEDAQSEGDGDEEPELGDEGEPEGADIGVLPPPFPSFSDAGPSQSATQTDTDEVLARILSRMDMFDNRMDRMETMMADRFSNLDVSYGSIESRLDTMQNQYSGLTTQLQTIIQMLQPPPPPPSAD